jgi:hypothetical protein
MFHLGGTSNETEITRDQRMPLLLVGCVLDCLRHFEVLASGVINLKNLGERDRNYG